MESWASTFILFYFEDEALSLALFCVHPFFSLFCASLISSSLLKFTSHSYMNIIKGNGFYGTMNKCMYKDVDDTYFMIMRLAEENSN